MLLAQNDLRMNLRTIFGHSRSPKAKYFLMFCVFLKQVDGSLS